MDDYNLNTLTEAQHEWAIKLVNILSPLILDGINSMYNESLKLCEETGEHSKYLMTFQNFLARVPQWNNEMVRKECTRIVEKSGCAYLEDLISCVHIVHLKILTTIRTGKTQKKIEIDIPKLDQFIHKVYTYSSRELYENMYLFEKNVPPLVFQKNRKELNNIVKSAILDSVRCSIPVDQLLRAYLDETTDLILTEKEAKEDKKEDDKKEDDKKEEKEDAQNAFEKVKLKETISFSDKDMAVSVDNKEEVVIASKDIERLEKLSAERHAAAKAEQEEEEQYDKIKIMDDDVKLDITEIESKESLLDDIIVVPV